MNKEREPSVEFYQDVMQLWRWRVKAANGEIIASGESHLSKRDAERAFKTAAENMTRVLIQANLDDGD